MNSRHPLSRLRLASQLCIAGAWTTLALGFILVILFYVLSNPGGVQNGGPGLGVLIFIEIVIVMLSIFFFLVLYGIGALLHYMGVSKGTFEEGTAPAKMRNQLEEEGTQLEITPLQREQ